ncbi:hypothetical protein ILUMI_17563, partial [Ignelater luminosus]
VFGKVLIGAFQRKGLAKIIKDNQHLWDISKYPEELKDRFKLIFSTTVHLQKLFFYMTVVTMIAAIIRAYLSRQLALGVWLIEGHDIYYYFQFTVHGFMLFYSVVTQIVPIDEIFMTMCMMLIAHFTLLNYKLCKLSVGDILNEEDRARYIENLVSYIKYHEFLL